MDIMDMVRARQRTAILPETATPPRHEPEMLYIGCIDARLDPIDDIGIEKGRALIFRNIGALVLKDESGERLSPSGISSTGEIPPNTSVGAVLEFFLNYIPFHEGHIKHIVVSGHTDCGGIKACCFGVDGAHDTYLPLYLKSLTQVRGRILDTAKAQGWDEGRTLRALEQESVRQSMANLLTYPPVLQAIREGKLAVHGWVIDTATQRIFEMNPTTLEFEPMAQS